MRRFGCTTLLACLLGCATPAQEDRPYQLGLAAVERIEVEVFAEQPFSVYVSVYGQLPDGCTRLDRSRQDRFGSGIEVTLTTRRESARDCAADPRPFERRILLDVAGLPPGLYTVSVNGVQDTFHYYEGLNAPRRIDRLRNW
jgi:inhibitor of cysteine peptidase